MRDAADGMGCVSCERLYPKVGAVHDFRFVGPLDTESPPRVSPEA